MRAWNSFSSPQEMNCSSKKLISDNCLVNQYFVDKQIDHFNHFQSPPALPSSSIIHKVDVIRESEKLGPVCSSDGNQFSSGTGLAPAPAPNFHCRNGGVANHGFDPISNEFVEENLPNLANSMALHHHHLSPLSNDPEFYCFGNRNFNLPRSHSAVNVTELPHSAIDMATIWNSPSLQQGGGSSTEINKLKELPPIPPNSNECSSISEQIPSGEEVSNEMNSRKRKAVSKNIAMKNVSTKAVNSQKGIEEDGEIKGKRRKTAEAKSSKKCGSNREEVTAKSDEPPKDYIHVRARRGQATDSHSLAERVRREKIGERMKLLQDLVPGCNKVTGKALMLDEIINYVQSLQRQVEFLSMKLASVDPRKEVDMNNVASKPIIQQQNAPLPQSLYTQDLSVPSFYGHQQKQLALMNINASLNHQSTMDPVHKLSYQNLELQLPSLNAFADGGLPQFNNPLCDDDLHSIVRMGLGQNANKKQRFNQ